MAVSVTNYYQSGKSHGTSTFNSLGYSLDCHYSIIQLQLTLGFTVMYWGVDYSDPNVQLEFLPGGTVGQRAGWTAEMNPELAAMYQEAMEATDNDARTQVLENIQDAMYEDGPFIVIAQAPAHIAHSSRLDGVDIFDSYTIDLTEINVK